MHELWTYMAQRDDAKDVGDEAGYNYWRGYIDALADTEGWTDGLDEIEAGYQLMQVEAAASMDAVAADARHRNAVKREP